MLVAADVLAAWCWWLEERQCVGEGLVVKTPAVCQSFGSSSLTVNSQRSVRILICCVALFCRINWGKCEGKRS